MTGERLLKVEEHSESIWCPHCGEEFGIESNIEYAHEAQDARTAAIKDAAWGALMLQLLRKIGVANSDTQPSIADIQMAAEEVMEHYDKDAACSATLKAVGEECQARVERILAWLEETASCEHEGDYVVLHPHQRLTCKGCRQALKQKYLE